MDENLIFDLVRQALWIAVRMSAPLLAVALIAGVVIGLFQALTSVQEMTLTFVPKILAVLVTVALSASFIGAQISIFTDTIFSRIQSGF